MQIDESLLESAECSDAPVTVVRFYAWDIPTVSIGRHQNPDSAVSAPYCQEHGIPIVKRPSGGRAVLHARELTYAVVSNDPRRFSLHSLDATYRMIAGALQAGLAHLKIASQLAEGGRETGRSTGGVVKSPCFASTSRHELVVSGKKIAGSAQRRLRRSFLQHGSIPLAVDRNLMAHSLGVSPDLIALTTTSVSEAAGREVGFEELAEALGLAFEKLFKGRRPQDI